MKHFLTESDFDRNEIIEVFEHASLFKQNRTQRPSADLSGQNWGMLFYKNSTRTRVSFEVGIRELGGNPLILDQSSTQIGRGESIEDTVRVLSRYLDGLIIRTHGHDIIEEFAQHSSIPVVNSAHGLSSSLSNLCRLPDDLGKNGGNTRSFRGTAGEKIGFFRGYRVQYGQLMDSGRCPLRNRSPLGWPRLTFDLSPKSRNFAKREVCPGLGVIRKIPERHPRARASSTPAFG